MLPLCSGILDFIYNFNAYTAKQKEKNPHQKDLDRDFIIKKVKIITILFLIGLRHFK